MALKYTIDTFMQDPDDASKTLISFKVTNDADKVFIISRSVTTGSNTDAQLCTTAQTAAQSEIDAWNSSTTNMGKTWNPDTNEIK